MDIELRHIDKSFGDTVVFRDLSLTVRAGRVSCLMMPSGWGKTTILRLLLGLETPDAGSITGVPEKKAAVFQEDRLCPGISALSNVLRVTGAKIRPEAEALLTRLGLGADMRKPARELSGGMGRRAAIARALLAESELLVLDEPFDGLDAETRARTAAVIREYAKGKTVILVTHDAEECALLGGEMLSLDSEYFLR